VDNDSICWYVSRRVELPIGRAAEALDELLRQSPHDARRKRTQLPGSLAVKPVIALPGRGRRLRGLLSLRGLGGLVPVELELAAWSRHRSEIGVRPAGRPPRSRPERYFAAATAALRDLERELSLIAGAERRSPARRAS
jgi:hypothetical protein